MTNAEKIAFLDRDGTLIREPSDEQVDRLEKIELVRDVVPALLRLRDAGYRLVMVSNQDGLGSPAFPEADFQRVQDFVLSMFASQGIEFSDVFICPHLPEDRCACRKPLPGILGDFLRRVAIDTHRSFVVGDREADLELAANLGIRGYQIGDAGWLELVRTIVERPRRGAVTRHTRETIIEVCVNLDDESPIEVSTGIGFFDHMLEQIAKHGGFSLTLQCDGDLHVDEHHTVEDTALALGQALREALGDKLGIGRYGFTVPMDESRAQAAVDISGRPYFVFEGCFPRQQVGELPTELVPHFFRSLADSLGAALHLTVQGENTHHMVEACFKAVGRALRQAATREGLTLPSTKGVL
jgi:imidazoleglycerol-phosphate dehydratase/histidinol-phosphatase